MQEKIKQFLCIIQFFILVRIYANHYLIAQGMGFLVIPEKDVPEFKKLLVQYYEGEPLEVIGAFLKERCWKNF